MIWLMKGQKRDAKCKVVPQKCYRMSQAIAALAIDDEICRESDYYESLLKQNGIEVRL